VSILADFLGRKCSGCGASKDTNRSFCFTCYRKLPKGMQSDLWRRFGCGYEAAFNDALAWLKAQAPQDGLFEGGK
jgi:hypothetical protein